MFSALVSFVAPSDSASILRFFALHNLVRIVENHHSVVIPDDTVNELVFYLERSCFFIAILAQ